MSVKWYPKLSVFQIVKKIISPSVQIIEFSVHNPSTIRRLRLSQVHISFVPETHLNQLRSAVEGCFPSAYIKCCLLLEGFLQLSSRTTFLLEKLTITQCVRKFPSYVLWNFKFHLLVYNSPPEDPYTQLNP